MHFPGANRHDVQDAVQLHTHGARSLQGAQRSVRAEQLLTEAKEAVDRAKEAGRNRVEHVDAVIGRAGMSMD